MGLSPDIVLNENGVNFQNYAISAFFKRRLSKQCNQNSKKQRQRVINFEDVKIANQPKCAIHLNHKCLLSGFVRSLMANLSVQIVPISIIKILENFYYASTHLLLISGSAQCHNTKHNQLHILNIGNQKRYKFCAAITIGSFAANFYCQQQK